MKKNLFLFICLLPGFLMAQSSLNNHITPLAGGVVKDTTQHDKTADDEEQQPSPKQGKKVRDKPDGTASPEEWKKNGFIHALFHAGINFAQIDGDAYAGFNKVGFDGGAGALLRFHKYLSASIEANYTMWGAQATLLDKINLYKANLNYVQVPVSINVHEKDIIMFSAGLNFSFLVNYNERNELGNNITDTIQPQPKKFDLDAFGALHFIIKKQFAIGIKYSYSMLPFRGVERQYISSTHIHGEYNNVLTIRFMYILSAWKKK